MEIKRQRKPKGLKRKRLLKGGNWGENFKNWMNGTTENLKGNLEKIKSIIPENFGAINEEQKGELNKWFNFSELVNTIPQTECKKTECIYDEPSSKEEAEQIASGIIGRFKTQNETRKLLIKTQEEQIILLQQQLEIERKTNIIKHFDVLFKDILEFVNEYIGNNKTSTTGLSRPFKTIIVLLNALPNIENNLGALIKGNINDLKNRYEIILKLLREQCAGMMQYGCSFAVKALGEEISGLYKKLKKDADVASTNNTDTDTLIQFIRDVVPIMIKNLQGTPEFEEYLKELKNIEEELNSIPKNIPPAATAATGGKKSRAVRKQANHAKPTDAAKQSKKVILGKERCIYKIKGSNKDHIKYKGALITVADYKKLMRG